jgi:hypothetical protein
LGTEVEDQDPVGVDVRMRNGGGGLSCNICHRALMPNWIFPVCSYEAL